jgi:hypothetical protein
MIDKLKNKLKQEGRSFRWFVLTYLPEMKYYTAMSQISGYNPLTESLTDAIKKYLGEK